MERIKELIKLDKASATPVYPQITQALIRSIHQGKLRKGLGCRGRDQ